MSITDELRDWFKDRMFMANGWQEIHDIADRIDAEHEETIRQVLMGEGGVPATDENMAEHGWVHLPVDADGVPIRVGDVMDKGKVTCIRDCGKGWEVVLDSLYTYDSPSLRHHKPTVDDLLFSYGQACIRTSDEAETDAAKQTMLAWLRKDYAAKLRLADDGDEQ